MSMRMSIVVFGLLLSSSTSISYAQIPAFVAASNETDLSGVILTPVESKFLEILTVSARPTYGISVGMSDDQVHEMLTPQGIFRGGVVTQRSLSLTVQYQMNDGTCLGLTYGSQVIGGRRLERIVTTPNQYPKKAKHIPEVELFGKMPFPQKFVGWYEGGVMLSQFWVGMTRIQARQVLPTSASRDNLGVSSGISFFNHRESYLLEDGSELHLVFDAIREEGTLLQVTFTPKDSTK